MKELIYEIKEEKVYLTLSRPNNLNTFTDELVDELFLKINEIKNDKNIRIVFFEGAGDAFCAGVEVKGKEYNPLNAREFLIKFNNLLNAIENLPQPSIALIDGPAVAGGLELALACTFRFCTERSKLGLPEARLGLVAAGGASFRLPRLVGFSKALEIALTGELVSGTEAEKIGLVSKSFKTKKELKNYGEKFAKKIINNAPLAVTFVKEAFYKNQHLSVDSAMLIEILSASVNHYTEDKKEGIKAFFEKREPNFKGK